MRVVILKLNLKEYKSRIDRNSWQSLRYRGMKKTKKKKALSWRLDS